MMLALGLALQLAVAPVDTVQVNRDVWLGADKFKHAGMSYAITAFTFAATDSEAAAIASAGVAGILKEVYDRRRGSVFSLRDLIWDAAGIALGYAVVKQTR
jgi:uncharacterized protein YfiM (DUF2279 family)